MDDDIKPYKGYMDQVGMYRFAISRLIGFIIRLYMIHEVIVLALYMKVSYPNLQHIGLIYIYNSVLTCRQHIINSSASAPPNATKIAVKKVSDVDVCMFGPEL